VETSTPTIKGISRIEKSYEVSDQRRFYVPCPSCNEKQILKWGNVKWEKDELGDHDPLTAYYQCEFCDHQWTDTEKVIALKYGEWIAEKPFKGHAGFHLNELYSPFRKWKDIVQSFLDKKAAGDLQSFVNVSLAETWEEDGESANDHELYARREVYPDQVPPDFWVLTAGVDVQDDRLEIEVVAWDEEERSANIDYRVIYGDPDDPVDQGIWAELDSYLNSCYNSANGLYQIAATCVDSGGHHTSRVYDYCKTRRKDRIFAIKGRGGEGVPIVSNPMKRVSGREKRKVDLYHVGVDGVKLTIMRRLQLKEPGAPGYCRFPEDRDEDYFKQLTSEKLVTRYKQGQATRSWVKPDRARNEALDCRVYAYAALKILNPVWSALVDRVTDEQKTEPAPVEEKAAVAEKPNDGAPRARKQHRRRSNRRGFASSW
jgi:phage terminase large subunit GpA-like protein